jgi:hypothetical protein
MDPADPQRASDSVPEPENPTDTPLVDVSGAGADAATEGQFRAVDGGRIQCLTCRQDRDAEEYRADDVTRLEGVSDPDDMVMVVPVTCPNCGATGSLVLGYGPTASGEDADALAAMGRH